MAERVEREEQSRVVANNTRTDLVENIQQICFMITKWFMIKIFMFGTCLSEGEFEGACGGDDRHVGSIYYYGTQGNCQLGSLEVYELQTGGGKLILPGVFQSNNSMQALSNSHLPSDFHSFPNRSDYIDIHRFESNFREVFQHEYNNPGVIENRDDSNGTDDTVPNETESTAIPGGRRGNTGYRRITMTELTRFIRSRHDPCTPSMKDIEQRMRTFYGWRMNGNWAVDKVVKAGFFYTGIKDRVECYHCGLRVREWDEAPLVTHVRWMPSCRFLRDTFPLDDIHGILYNRKQM